MSNSSSREFLSESIGRYKERAKLLRQLSFMLTNLDEDDKSGDTAIKRRTIFAVANSLHPGLVNEFESIWEAAKTNDKLAETIITVLKLGSLTTVEEVIQLVKQRGMLMGFTIEQVEELTTPLR